MYVGDVIITYLQELKLYPELHKVVDHVVVSDVCVPDNDAVCVLSDLVWRPFMYVKGTGWMIAHCVHCACSSIITNYLAKRKKFAWGAWL